MPWTLVYGNINYSQWLPMFLMEMSSLLQVHCQLIKEIFSQSLTENSSLFPNLWVDCVMNKDSKLKAGWERLLKNEISLDIPMRNTKTSAQ